MQDCVNVRDRFHLRSSQRFVIFLKVGIGAQIKITTILEAFKQHCVFNHILFAVDTSKSFIANLGVIVFIILFITSRVGSSTFGRDVNTIPLSKLM